MPPELVPPALVVVVVVVAFRCLTVPPLPLPALGEAVPALGDRPTDVALAAGPGCKVKVKKQLKIFNKSPFTFEVENRYYYNA